MAKFTYKVKKGPKEVIEGVIEGETEDEAVDKLNQMGYIPIRISPFLEEDSKRKISGGDTANQIGHLRFFNKVRSNDLTIFTEQLASLVKSKIPILEAIKVLYEQTESVNLKEIIAYIQREIRDGRTMSQSLRKYPKVFSPIYINMIEAGERGGVLEETLRRLAEFRNKEEAMKAKIISALAYPLFIIIVGIVTIFILLGFVIPRMSTLFNETGQVLPLPTRILLSLGYQVKNYWYWGILIIVLIAGILKRSGAGKNGKIFFDRLKLKLPLMGDFVKKSGIARFSRTLALLLSSGITLSQAIKISIPTLDNEVFKLELDSVHRDIVDGVTFEQSLKKSTWFPNFTVNMLTVGEKGGHLEGALLEVAEFYERDVDKVAGIIASLLEPAIILVMGIVVGFIVFAMLLPIFQINLGMS